MDIARSEAEKFMGREDELFRVKEYLLSSRTGPFIVYGPTGSGKTCFISKVATMTGWMGKSNPFFNTTVDQFCSF